MSLNRALVYLMKDKNHKTENSHFLPQLGTCVLGDSNKFPTLNMPINDYKNTAAVDFGVANKF